MGLILLHAADKLGLPPPLELDLAVRRQERTSCCPATSTGRGRRHARRRDARISRSTTSGTPGSHGQPPRARPSERSCAEVATPALVPRTATNAPPKSRTEPWRKRCRRWQPKPALELCGHSTTRNAWADTAPSRGAGHGLRGGPRGCLRMLALSEIPAPDEKQRGNSTDQRQFPGHVQKLVYPAGKAGPDRDFQLASKRLGDEAEGRTGLPLAYGGR